MTVRMACGLWLSAGLMEPKINDLMWDNSHAEILKMFSGQEMVLRRMFRLGLQGRSKEKFLLLR